MVKEHLFYPIKKILLPTDGSEHSIKAAKYAAEIATKHGSKVTLLHVLETLLAKNKDIAIGSDLDSVVLVMEGEAEIKKRGKKVIAETKKIFNNTEVQVTVRYFLGLRPSKLIVDIAEKENFDLIIIGARGIGGMQRLMLGSVSDIVARTAPCPVFIVR
jgi:nucleotide-binding universal stress UspA family protein